MKPRLLHYAYELEGDNYIIETINPNDWGIILKVSANSESIDEVRQKLKEKHIECNIFRIIKE
ncbi:MAG: hypothetical protein VZS44_09840 [Bacilli bacterium]|nr:hypothetical protein [Bacilli bacterium]